MNGALDRQLLADDTIFAGRASRSAPLGFYENPPGWNPDWLGNFEQDYGSGPEKAKALLADAGQADGMQTTGLPMNMFGMNMFGFREAPDVMQAIGAMFRDVGIDMVFEESEQVNLRAHFRAISQAAAPEANAIRLLLPLYKMVLAQLKHFFHPEFPEVPVDDDEWSDGQFAKLQQTVDMGDRDAIQREIGNYIYDQHALMPMVYVFIEWTVNPKYRRSVALSRL